MKMANGWKPDETHVAPLPYQREPEKADPFCCIVEVELNRRHIRCIADINRYLLILENIVRPKQKREDMIRLCVDVHEIIDLKLKAADVNEKVAITLESFTPSQPDSNNHNHAADTADHSSGRPPSRRRPFLFPSRCLCRLARPRHRLPLLPAIKLEVLLEE